ncbi:MAG: 3-deoxy-manno-octulosonate cytidylyltransferase [Cyclobacteriaceae bacterium]
MRVLGVIPARYNSQRLPGKPLSMIGNKPMIQHVYENTIKCKALEQVVIATDDERIFDVVVGFGGQVMMTSKDHKNGTERCAEVVTKFKEYRNLDYVVNIQGDEPFIDKSQIQDLCNLFDGEVELATLIKKIENPEFLDKESIMKVITNLNDEAIYFSRTALPFYRDLPKTKWLQKHDYYKHICIYGYKLKTLKEITKLPVSPLEKAESLEQLRWIENGYKIKVARTAYESMGVDTIQDLEKANAMIS